MNKSKSKKSQKVQSLKKGDLVRVLYSVLPQEPEKYCNNYSCILKVDEIAFVYKTYTYKVPRYGGDVILSSNKDKDRINQTSKKTKKIIYVKYTHAIIGKFLNEEESGRIVLLLYSLPTEKLEKLDAKQKKKLGVDITFDLRKCKFVDIEHPHTDIFI